MVAVGKDDATHTHLRGVVRTDDGGLLRDDLGDTGRTGAEVPREAFKVVEVGPDVLGDTDAAVPRLSETELEGTKEASAARDTDGHETELADDLLPLLDADAPLVTEGVEDLLEALDTVSW